jgi:hypothetical protein
MSDSIPPYLPEVLEDEIAEVAIQYQGRTLTVRYRPSAMLRASGVEGRPSTYHLGFLGAALVEIIDRESRYGTFQDAVAALPNVDTLEFGQELGAACIQWCVAYIKSNPERIRLAKARYEAERGGT